VRQIRYFQECALAALPGDARTVPPSYRYFIDMASGCADYSRKTLRKTLYYSASRRKLLKY